MDFDLLIVGAGPGGIFSAYEAMKLNPELKIAPDCRVFSYSHLLSCIV